VKYDYVLTDIAGEHYWTGNDFIPVRYFDPRVDLILRFATEQEAYDAAAECLRQRRYLQVKVLRRGRRPTWGAS
jgi:hypothetical protein